jgi:hypothetical protein
MSDVEKRYHESWLGMVQPIEGLVFSVPVLVDASVMDRSTPDVHEAFLAHVVVDEGDGGVMRARLRDTRALLREVLQFADGDLLEGSAVPRSLEHFVPEGGQFLQPTFVIKGRTPEAPPQLLWWQLPDGLDLDDAETVTGPWDYAPTHKLDRMLRGLRVPVGVVSNGEAIRLMVAPHGESTGHLTFRIADMAHVAGRPIFDAFRSLLSAHRFFGVADDRTLPALLRESRLRQANVTNALAEQVFEALTLLLAGFEAAAERDGTTALSEAMKADSVDDGGGHEGEHVYGGLLTAMLRLVFLLYAEDRGLMPMQHPTYQEHLSVLGLFEQLQHDAGMYPDTMGRRFGAWPRLLALFRAVYEGAEGTSASGAALSMPARRGRLFDPNTHPFLEGWSMGGAAPHDVESRARVQVPSVDDETVGRVLEKLLVLDGQRLSYRALDVEQIGSVYEALMGYSVKRLVSDAVCLKDSGVWLETDAVLATPANRREALVVDESGQSKGKVAKLAEALKAAKTSDDVVAALAPIRKNPKTIPVKKAGGLVLQPGAERRRTSSHYTPRSLSAPIVEKTLRPLLQTMAAGAAGPRSTDILELKVCDPAMGSGAFLVEACRFLGDELVAAWTRERIVKGIEANHGDPTNYARRLIAQRCLYGVDKNPYAVTLAKLSLWLVSLAANEPFTFVDHALRWGDSLVGLSLEQLRRFHWAEGDGQGDWIAQAVSRDLDEAMYHRRRILELAKQSGLQNAKQKEELLRDADDSVRNARLLADILVGAFFAHDKDKDREKERTKRLTAAQAWSSTRREPTHELLEWQRQMHAATPPFHWPLEFPEVFYAGRPDPLEANKTNRVAWMDAFIGNPPFVGGRRMSGEFGGAYTDFLSCVYGSESGDRASTNADLSAFFFRQCWGLLGDHGTIGLIATNTIAQGDTRTVGLKAMLAAGGRIIDATSSMLWPGEAAVSVSVVHMAKGGVTSLPPVLNGTPVSAISSRLRPTPERPDPVPLRSNQSLSYQGSVVVGSGFILTDEERKNLIEKNPRNAELIFSYLGGEDVNSSPTQQSERFIINFGSRSIEESARWPDLLEIVRERVKPERDRVNRETHRRFWWHYGDKRPALYDALSRVCRCLVVSQVTKHLVLALEPTNLVFSHTLYVFPFEDDAHFAVMQSRVHEPWARLLSSSLEDRLRYAPSDCFETFPFPPAATLAAGGAVDVAGKTLYEARAAFMVETQQGLTSTYNRLKDPAEQDPRVLAQRALHEAMDRAVLDAYGWHDVVVPPFCPRTPEETAALARFEDEVIDRLFALNSERAAEEARAGLSTVKPAPKAKKPAKAEGAASDSDSADAAAPPAPKKPRKKRGADDDQGSLL